jgi:methyl-accepting chemotaxis protein
LAAENEVDELVRAAGQGDFSHRLSRKGRTGFFANLATGKNGLMTTSEQGLKNVAKLLHAFTEGDLTKRIERDYEGLFGRVKDSATQNCRQIASMQNGEKVTISQRSCCNLTEIGPPISPAIDWLKRIHD